MRPIRLRFVRCSIIYGIDIYCFAFVLCTGLHCAHVSIGGALFPVDRHQPIPLQHHVE